MKRERGDSSTSTQTEGEKSQKRQGEKAKKRDRKQHKKRRKKLHGGKKSAAQRVQEVKGPQVPCDVPRAASSTMRSWLFLDNFLVSRAFSAMAIRRFFHVGNPAQALVPPQRKK